MRKLYLFFAFVFFSAAYGQEPFIMTWEVSEVNNSAIEVPIQSGTGVNYTIDFGDGTILTNRTGPTYHNYTSLGTHTVSISGNYRQIKFANSNYTSKLKTIEQWGDTQWISMEGAFKGCSFMIINAIDTPDLSQVTSTKEMFSNTNFNQSINTWDVSNVTDMTGMFSNSGYNQPLNNWDVSNVITMESMFEYADYNQPLDNWNVSNVTNMKNMFTSAMAFNQPIDNWDVSNVAIMQGMFSQATAFNQPLNSWNVSSVTNMVNMFGSSNFNQPLNNWNVSNVITMENMFASTSQFNQSLNDWDVSSVTTMKGIFKNTIAFNMPLDNWDVSNVISMEAMFSDAVSFNQELENWDVSSVTNMSSMFSGSDIFNQPLNNWNVSNVTNMASMFGVSVFNQPLNNWDVSGVTNMANMFSHSYNFNQDLSTWEFNHAVFFNSFMSAASAFDTGNYDALLLRFAQLGLENREFDAYGLHYCDATVRNYLINHLNFHVMYDSWDGSCIPNTLAGNVFFDEDANGCDDNDIVLNHAIINIHNDIFSYLIPVSEEGSYNTDIPQGNYTVELLNLPDYFAPASFEASFEGFGNEEQINFCITANETIQDLNIALLPISDARPGFPAQYQIVVENASTQTIANATVTLTFDNILQSFESADPTPIATTANQLSFELTNIQLLESRVINFTTEFFSPPVVNGTEIAAFTATVMPENGIENTPDNNTYTLLQEVVNSFDPNDKQVLQGDEISLEQAEGYLDYIIRFQNTGTASAVTVRIKDNLPENVDWNTLRPINASHNYHIEVKDDHTAEFIFDNINLPHEAADEPGSHGFIAYKIKPVATVTVGDIITGNAEIFFDYNLPIVTNFATTEVVESMGVNENSINRISIYPNPVSHMLNLSATNGITIEEVKIINLQGRELMSFKGAESINVEDLSTGVYILMIKTDAGIEKHKLVKK